jgi:hypothetical protein
VVGGRGARCRGVLCGWGGWVGVACCSERHLGERSVGEGGLF